MRARETEVVMKMPMHVAAIGKKNSDCPKEMHTEADVFGIVIFYHLIFGAELLLCIYMNTYET